MVKIVKKMFNNIRKSVLRVRFPKLKKSKYKNR